MPFHFFHPIDLNLVDWGDNNRLAVALAQTVYVWYSATMSVNMICQMPAESDYCSSVAWMKGSNYLALGTKTAEVQVRSKNLCVHSW